MFRKKQQSPCEEGGLKFEKKDAGKIGHRFPCNLYFFIYPQPNNIGPARVWSGEGRGHSYCILALYWTTWDMQ